MAPNFHWFFIIFLILNLTGCGHLDFLKPDSEKIQKKGWARHKEEKLSEPPLYCYRTLGEIMCYKNPIKEREDLLIVNPKPTDVLDRECRECI
jgi:predicted small lipoprotein YifL